MAMHDVVVTGVGIVSCAGESIEAHLEALVSKAQPKTDGDMFPSYWIHPVGAVEYDKQIPKKSDQRQMEPWQRLGVYAAGLALDSAGVKEDVELKHNMHLIVAAGGGERDYAVDGQILTGMRDAANPGAYLNERLMNDIRPTLFLAQLSNLLAGNISIVHGVTGASRTFMGEEACGIDAIRIAHGRIRAGQTDSILVGGSYNAERPDALLIHEMGGYLWKKPFRSVWERDAEGGGFVLGSGGAFIMLESREHAEKRGATIMAKLEAVSSDRSVRTSGSVKKALTKAWNDVGATASATVFSGATGVAGITAEEQKALSGLASNGKIHALGDLVGHTIEAQTTMGAVLGAAQIHKGDINEAVVTMVGHRRGEGALRLVKA
ncbi:beta-ketoacyl-ACP synthase [Microvirga sp. W0021]|uniref:Beta-ketoacyl-ACP synthase n=1 Tax=Hohaiivirga grylli TaxID=3133970 RepID=A0ABV0BEX8_9HYPH